MNKETVFNQLRSFRGNCVKIKMRDGSAESIVVPKSYEIGILEPESKDGKETVWLRIWNNELQFRLENIASITKTALLHDIDVNGRLGNTPMYSA
ncbi:MAG: hypothetical protein NDI60_01870 [Elusimicrobiales bacterium]|nr:hypothetical protein [Elusimicrobiales bacterium]